MGETLEGVPGIYKGIPTVSLDVDSERKSCPICADDTYWNTEIAESVCQYNGFEGSMIIRNDTTPNERDCYAVCSEVESPNFSQLDCEYRESCEAVPIISCLLPGYVGCYPHTDTNPFFPDSVQVLDQPINIQTCAAACPDSPYLGLANGQECICGSVLGDRSDEGICDLPCPGDDLQLCGGENSITVYSADVIGKCGNEGPVNLVPNQPLRITSPGFPSSYDNSESEICTWSIDVDVAVWHNLDITMVFDLNQNGIDRLNLSSNIYGMSNVGLGNTKTRALPYRSLRDTFIVTFAFSRPVPADKGFLIEFRLTPDGEPTTTDPEEHTTSKAELSTNMTNLSKLGIFTATIVFKLVLR